MNIFNGVLFRAPSREELVEWSSRSGNESFVDDLLTFLLQCPERQEILADRRNMLFRPGHYYSPIVDVESVRHLYSSNDIPTSLLDIDINQQRMQSTWKSLSVYFDIEFPLNKVNERKYYSNNRRFGIGDAGVLHAMLSLFRPKKFVEIGSGFSSAVLIDLVEEGGLDCLTDVVFIDPFPTILNSSIGVPSSDKYRVIEKPVQFAPVEIFASLNEGDFLFIDSTHVLKTGSDVCYELFDILPSLRKGVMIHFHDIFWPFEYPEAWVIKENRSWNELYAIRALLSNNRNYEIVFFNDYFFKHCREDVLRDFPAMASNAGGSLWLRKLV